MSASSIELGVNGQPGHDFLVNRVLMHDCDNVRVDKENLGHFSRAFKMARLGTFSTASLA